MKVLRIGRTHQGGTVRTTDPKIAAQYAGKKNTLVITDGLSDFYRYFSPILSALDDLHWLIASDTFSCGFPNEWRENAWHDEKTDLFRSPQIDEFETHILQRGPGTSLFTKPGFPAKYCQYFYEDWCDMCSFRSPLKAMGENALGTACWLVGHLGTRKHARALLPYIMDEREGISRQAASSITGIGGESIVKPFANIEGRPTQDRQPRRG